VHSILFNIATEPAINIIMPEDFLKLLEHLTVTEYQQIAGPDWPDFATLKTGKNISKFIVDELTQMLIVPKPPVVKVTYVEFYITNVCNMTCGDCRSFNNFNFKGHYEFDLEMYQAWADKVDVESYNILGGEPLLHPRLQEWLEGPRRLWPGAFAKIDTNGTHITKVKNLHQLLVDNQYSLCINMHNPGKRAELDLAIAQAFGPCQEVDKTDPRIHFSRTDSVALSNRSDMSIYMITELGLTLEIRPTTAFQPTPASSTNWKQLLDGTGSIESIYLGNAELSHSTCVGKTCHVMRDGQFYKCALVATLPEFLEQKKIQWPDERLYDYQPLTADTFTYEGYQQMQNTIPQCAFCLSGTVDTVSISLSDIKRKKDVLL
jgi:hypothetical protein